MAYVDPIVVTPDDTSGNSLALPPATNVGYAPDSNALMPQQVAQADTVEGYLRQAATKRRIDPDVVVKVAGHEGLHGFDPNKPDAGGDEGSSFGPLQLHYAGMSKSMPHAGLGDEFTQQTGLDARDPSTWKQQIDFGLDYAAQHGWSAWMGAKAAGVGPFDGITGAKAQGVDTTGYKPSNNALSLPSAMGGNPAVASASNQFPAAPSASGPLLQNTATKRLMTLMYLKSALNNVQLQRVDYDPWAVIGGGKSNA